MTPDERERHTELLEKFRYNSDLIELLDLETKNYQDVILEKISIGEGTKGISFMSAGITNLRNELSKEEVQNKGEYDDMER